MSDLRDLPDLASDVSERVVTPPYDAVSRRVRARRLRGAATSLAVAVLMVGGVAVWQNVATTAGPPIPQPLHPTPIPPTDESQWRAVVDGTLAHPFEVTGTDDGAVAVVWRALEQPEPTFALVIREADGTVHGMRLDEPLDLTPVPGGWVGLNTARGYLIGSDGGWTDLGQPGEFRQPRPGDVFVRGRYGISRLYSPADHTWSVMPLPSRVADAYVTSDGVLMTCGDNGRGEIVVSVSDRLIPSPPGQTCVMAGRDDDIAVVGLGDEPDGGIPMTGFIARIDLTWVMPRITDMLDGVTSVVVTPAGTTIVTNASDGRSIVVHADGRGAQLDRKVGEAFVSGDRLYVTSYGARNGPIYYSDDDGVTWTQTTLPGNETSED